MRTLLVTTVALALLGRSALASACSPQPPDPNECHGFLFQTGVSVPTNATRDPLLYVPSTADIATVHVLRASDRSEVEVHLTETESKSEPQLWKITFVDRQPGEYIVTGVDPCSAQKDLGTFTLTETAALPTTLGQIVATRQPTLDVTESRGTNGDCSAIEVKGRSTKTDVTLTIDAAARPWSYVSDVRIEVDGQDFGGSDRASDLEQPSGQLTVSLTTICGGEAAFTTGGEATVKPGRHTIRMTAKLDRNAATPTQVVSNEVTVQIACDGGDPGGVTNGGNVTGNTERPAASDSSGGCSVATSASSESSGSSMFAALAVVGAVLASMRRRTRGR